MSGADGVTGASGGEGAMLAEQLHRLLGAEVDAGLLARVEAGEGAGALEDKLAGLGLPLALASEEAGGVGLGWGECAEVLVLLGYWAAPMGLGEAMTANWVLGLAGREASEHGAPALTADLLQMDDKGRVSGHCVLHWAAPGDEVLAVARAADGARLVRLAPADAWAPLKTLGRDPRLRARFDGAEPLDAMPAPLGEASLRAPLATLRAAQIAGGLARALSESIEYGNTRKQFGRPIGKFQAIQHMIAELAAEAAAAKAGLRPAFRALDAVAEAPEAAALVVPAVAAAKTRAGMAAAKGAAAAHAVHGAIGVTQEHVLHHVTRRLWQWRDEAGDENQWAEALGRAAIAGGSGALWPVLVALTGG